MDNKPVDRQMITRGPHVDPVVVASIHAPADLVSEGEIRAEERGWLEYKPTRPYHDRIASWMFSLQNPAESRRPKSKQQLICQRCEQPFEGRKGQRYCRPKGCDSQPMVVEEHVFGECECVGCQKGYTVFMETRAGFLLEKYGARDDGSFAGELNEKEKQYILDFAKHQVSNDEQQ